MIEAFTPDQIITKSWTLWVKTTPTRIKIIDESDRTAMGPIFTDLEGREQRVALGRCICIGPEGEKWTCSLESLKRDRYAVSEPDAEGYRLYRMKNPRPVRCFDIPYSFILSLPGESPWRCEEEVGGIITWNGKYGHQLDMRVIQRSIFEITYERCL